MLAVFLCAAALANEPAPATTRVPDADLLPAVQQTVRAVVQRLQPSLVRIDTVGGAQPPARGVGPDEEADDDQSSRRQGQSPFREAPGSDFILADGPTTGIVYSPDGYILTSSFNFVREPVIITVTLADGRHLAADLVARDQVRKLALLKVDAEGLTVPEWCPLGDVAVGHWAIALGLGFGGSSPSVSLGIVSGLNRMRGNAVQTDAKLSTVNYGGPLCDIRGRVIGLCVPMAHRPGELAGVEMYDAGVGFAVPSRRLADIVPKLQAGTSFHRGWLGASINPMALDAALIANVAVPSPLHEAGVVPGDRITWAAGMPVRHYGDLVRALNMIPAGEEVALRMERDGAAFEVLVRLARNTELGTLPQVEEPFDPALPVPTPDESEE